MARCLLGLGSNLGDRRATLRQAISQVAKLGDCRLIACSRWHETTPIGGPSGQGAFLNGALLIDSLLPADELARALQAVESRLGRDRAIRWDARAIDIDLLLYGDSVIETKKLTVPHPRMSFRKFVLEPAAEIAGFMLDPVSGWTLTGLLSHLEGAARYVAVTSANPKIAAWLAERLCQKMACLQLEETCSLLPGAGDCEQLGTVEFSERADKRLLRSFWFQDKELSKRLPPSGEGSPLGVPPVVTAFWRNPTEQVPIQRGKPRESGQIISSEILSPALVIAVEPSSEKNFWKKIPTKKFQENSPVLESSWSSWRKRVAHQGHGPMAKIQSDDPAIVLQESIAAIRSIWPELAVKSPEELS